jgi:hypothetical protein
MGPAQTLMLHLYLQPCLYRSSMKEIPWSLLRLLHAQDISRMSMEQGLKLNVKGVDQIFLSFHLITLEFGLKFQVTDNIMFQRNMFYSQNLDDSDVQEAQQKMAVEVVLKKGRFKGKEI